MRNKSAYHLDGIPPLKEAIPLGLQHVLAMFVSNITPLIIVSGALNLPADTKTFLIQCTMLVAGLNTMLQAYTLGPVGARLPIVVGTSFAFVPVALSIGTQYGYEAILGAALVGGIFEAFIGLIIKRIRRYFPPVVTGVIVLSIGLSLLPVGVKNFAGGVGAADFGSFSNLFLGMIVLITIIFFKQFTKGITSTGSIFIGTIVGFIVAIFMGKVDLSAVYNAGYINIPRPFTYGFTFHLDACMAMIMMFIVSAVETVGDMSGVTMGGANRELTDKELSGGILADGVGSCLASCFSILPTTSFSQNTGLVAMTGVMSRFVVAVGAAFLVLGAFIPKIGALLAIVPASVIGGSLVMVFAMISISGINLITKEPLRGRNALILSVSLGLGYGLGSVPNALVNFPESIRLIFGGSGIVVSGSIAVILNMILPMDEEEKKCVSVKG
ncbi:Nucleobase transporter PlUacP [Fusobacterium sp. DD29]|uniref:uracil-xanthine permease family protein n=1 Tax=unclassified Fusobacterium TaxID=2648384 RepID=UPI001B8D791C|nr:MULTISPECIES: nucleobase:cation symporter-2 family protein [unclassified Fusobacterium]MBR8700385.1 Nucleobase transporter PlUacP [Fusobacterium sp. DD45]MBR8710078.1 Nucleobase transporter PlUacP [Fusobacterium sp. DD28]MBR8748378.1 Nucleobase transporter PlUacP [Fusobacterium sp. DD29]MBR8750656.1 Nucleobase transporter PlUacP [Fusobacterium sp. DD26]MBR8760648.1 Nucleobase transporter PlUacP [Fusobacterium sp. DD25]